VAKILVTGADGFVGRHLCAALGDDDVLRVGGPAGPAGVDERVELTDQAAVADLIARARPEAVAHLAAVSAVGDAQRAPRLAWSVNLMGTVNLLIAMKAHAPQCRLLYVSSAEVYGESFSSGLALDEDAPLRPLNPYAASKAAAEIAVGEAARTGLFATIARPFNHTGPGQPASFVIPAFAAQIAAIERGAQAPLIKHGNLDDTRDFLSVDDIVAAYVAILRRGRSLPNGLVLNLASGASHRIGDLLNALIARAARPIALEFDPARARSGGIQVVKGDASKAQALLDWRPKVSIETLLDQVLAHQRAAS
jgi:GDP-4-dehydro-6-deoxy-D-mannose reductase